MPDLRRIVDQRVGVELRCLIEELLASVENDVLSFSRYSDSLPHTGSRETAILQCAGLTRVGTALSGSGFYVIRNIAKHIATMTERDHGQDVFLEDSDRLLLRGYFGIAVAFSRPADVGSV